MKKTENNKFNFDLSKLELKELVKVYEEIDDFLKFLETSKIQPEVKEESSNA